MKKRVLSIIMILATLAVLLPGGSFGGTEVYAAGKSVKSISIKSKPSKLSYKVGDKLSAKGMKIIIRYAGNAKKTKTSGFTCSPSKFTKAGKQKVTVRYGGKSASFTVTVTKKAAAKKTTAKKTTAQTMAAKKTAAQKTSTAKRKNAADIYNPNYKSPYYIVVYTGSQSAVVYGKDSTDGYNVVVKSFTVSTGKKSTPTAKGMYHIRAKYRWKTLNGPCYGQYCSSISPHYLFHSVPYVKKTVNTLYNNSYDKLGKAASHGCIRMCVRDSKWIYDNCPIGTQVRVVWKSGPKGAGVPKRSTGKKFLGWDPSDKWAKGNPYFSASKTTASKTTAGKTSASTTQTTAADLKTIALTARTTTSATQTEAATSSTTAVTGSTTAATSVKAAPTAAPSTVPSPLPWETAINRRQP